MSDPPDDGLAEFAAVRPRLFGIAYRMLGSGSEAEDIVQDVWMRWQAADRSVVRDATAFLTAATTRVAINVLKSARARRETYVGSWMPEPVDTSADPALGAERAEALELAVLLLLETLTPNERAAYVLFEAFNYPHRRIAEILHLSEVNTRQLVTRARKHIAEGRRAQVSSAERQRLLAAFFDAIQRGDVAQLESLFAADVVSYADGGGFVQAARIPVVGRSRVAKTLAAIAQDFMKGVTISWLEANGQPCVLLSRAGDPIALSAIEASAEGIDRIMWVLRPSKLGGISHPPRVTPDG